jgi:hypothetical protein
MQPGGGSYAAATIRSGWVGVPPEPAVASRKAVTRGPSSDDVSDLVRSGLSTETVVSDVYFSADYLAARSRFRESVTRAGGTLDVLKVGARGPGETI